MRRNTWRIRLIPCHSHAETCNSLTPESLSTVLTRARRALALNFPTAIWVRCELSEVSERRGHRYLQLVEKGDGDATVARVQGVVWSRTYGSVVRKRGASAAEVLSPGQEVVLQVELDLHEVYGLKLVVADWDPAFTLGQLELRRRAIVDDLRGRGLHRRNGALPLPPVLQRLAVLSSARAAGYADFRAQLAANPHAYRFATTLFDVSVQGEGVAGSVAAALDAIAARREGFDAVVLLRGGGSRLDLASFDRLGVGEAIAGCPLPVLVGIGHETDETLPDLVAHTSMKTPTALADFVVERAARFEAGLLADGREIARVVDRRRARHAEGLLAAHATLATRTARLLERELAAIREREGELSASVGRAFERRAERLSAAEVQLAALDPRAVLRRGFAVVTRGGHPARRAADVSIGDRILTHFHDGTIESDVVES